MKIRLDLGLLEQALRKMGAAPVAYSSRPNIPPREPLDIDLYRGHEIVPTEQENTEGLLSFKGRQVLLYIKDHSRKIERALEDGRQGNRFHVMDCRTLKHMREQGRFQRYVVMNRLDGIFPISGRSWETKKFLEGDTRLQVCQNCLVELAYKGAGIINNAREVVQEFDLEAFFADHSSFFRQLPLRRSVKNWNFDLQKWSMQLRI